MSAFCTRCDLELQSSSNDYTAKTCLMMKSFYLVDKSYDYVLA